LIYKYLLSVSSILIRPEISMTSENNLSWLLVAFAMGTIYSKDIDIIRNMINSFVPVYTFLSALYVVALTLSYAWTTFFSEKHDIKISGLFVPPQKKQVREKKVEFEKNKIVQRDEAVIASLPKKDITEGKGSDEPITLTGSYRLIKNDGFKDFLAAQGVNYILRAAADKAITTHHVTHRGTTLRIRVSGIITGDTTYIIGGDYMETKIQDKIFHDSATWLPNKSEGVRITKVSQSEKYNLLVTRRLSADKQLLYITSEAVYQDGKRVQAVQTYQRI